MRSVISSLAFLVIVSVANADDGHWQSLFDGKSLEGWNAEDLDECFKLQDGAIGRWWAFGSSQLRRASQQA